MNTADMLAMSVVPFLFFAIWLGLVIYVVMLMTRLTRATERIADLMERNPPGQDRVSTPTGP